MTRKSILAFGMMLALAPALAACGGATGATTAPQTPSAIAPPAVSPAPSTPAPVNYDTPEYQRSNAANKLGAISAYAAGATGSGIVAAVIDSGVNPSLAEFSGKLSAASADIAGARGVTDEDGHGTSVSAVLLGAKNDSDTHGVAINATLLALCTDTPGSCADMSADGGCSHSDDNIARALDVATRNGARVVNLSLGGAGPNSLLRAAINRATQAGVIIVISAGNDGLADPDAFALVANDPVANGLVVIAGGVDDSNQLSVYSSGGSNKAGLGASHYLVALATRVRTINQDGAAILASGTSYAAPAIAGAVALLAQAFPNLTSAQILNLLYTSAHDLGTAGNDDVFGYGLVDLAAAFVARGATSVAGTSVLLSTTDNGTLSAPMGDASLAGLSTLFVDSYGRAYEVDLSGSFGRAYSGARLWSALDSNGQTAGAGFGATGIALSVSGADRGDRAGLGPLSLTARDRQTARALAGWIVSRLSRDTSFAVGVARGSGALIDQMALRRAAGFLLADAAGDSLGFRAAPAYASALRHQIGGWGVSAAIDKGDALVWDHGLRQGYEHYPYIMTSLSLDRRFGAARLGLKASQLDEKGTVLGARFGGMLGAPGATTRLLGLTGNVAMPSGWRVEGRYQRGWTRVGAGGVRRSVDALATEAWSFDLLRDGLFQRGDAFGLRVSQPVRVASGGFDLTLPVAWDYATGAATNAVSRMNLAPTGRERDAEVHYALPVLAGSFSTSLFLRMDPGHYAAVPDDLGVAMRFAMAF
jgi:hypothetical protein